MRATMVAGDAAVGEGVLMEPALRVAATMAVAGLILSSRMRGANVGLAGARDGQR